MITIKFWDSQNNVVMAEGINFRAAFWDLLVYYLAGSLTKLVGLEHLNWDQPPGWAEEWDQNDLVFDPVEQEKPFAAEVKRKSSLSSLADNLA